MLQLIQDGGPFALLIVGAFVVAAPAGLAAMALRDRTRFPGMLRGGIRAINGLGITGTLMGNVMMWGALDAAPTEKDPVLLLIGSGIAVIPMLLAGIATLALESGRRAVHVATAREVKERVRPARALAAVLMVSDLTLVAAMTAMIGVVVLTFPGAGTSALAAEPIEMSTAATTLLHAGLVPAVLGAGLGALAAVMGVFGGLRGLLSA
jgi:hypothetical protein